MSIEQASSLSRVPDERATGERDDPGPRGGVFDWMFRTARVALGPGSRSARAEHARSTRPGHAAAPAQRGLRALPAGVAPSHPLDPGLAARGGRGVPDPVGGRAARQLDQSDADQLSVGGGANLHGDARGRQPGEAYLGRPSARPWSASAEECCSARYARCCCGGRPSSIACSIPSSWCSTRCRKSRWCRSSTSGSATSHRSTRWRSRSACSSRS